MKLTHGEERQGVGCDWITVGNEWWGCLKILCLYRGHSYKVGHIENHLTSSVPLLSARATHTQNAELIFWGPGQRVSLILHFFHQSPHVLLSLPIVCL